MAHQIIPFTVEYKTWAAALLAEHWGSARIVTRGRLHQADELPGFITVEKGEPAGLVTYRITGGECEITTLNCRLEGRGNGSALVEAVKQTSLQKGCRRLWLITTNDNTRALHFWQKRGFQIAAIHVNAIAQSRKLKPEIPLIGNDGIEIRDEIELEIIL